MKKYLLIFFLFIFHIGFSQDLPKFSIKGTAGLSYDGYWLSLKPSGTYYPARRPTHLFRFNFQPIISYGNVKIPFNLNFSPMRNNFGSTPFGFGNLPGFPKQNFQQWIANPVNSIGMNPSYKWVELQLGTQYINLSSLSTGDIGIFGYGFSLKPNNIRLRFFDGRSQQAYEPFTSSTPPFYGTYTRRITMAQIGFERDDQYFAGFNIVKGQDIFGSIKAPITPFTPSASDNLIISFKTKINTAKGWYGQTELATSFYTKDNQSAGTSLIPDYQPLIKTNVTSFRDHAALASFGKKNRDWDLGASFKWLGAGYQTMGYQFMQNDRLEYTLNTRFNAFKKKTNVVASLGRRFGNWSTPSLRTKQIIANANIFTQFNEHFSLNASYNNYGFQTPTLTGIKNVGNDLGINPNYVWSTTKMSNLLSLTYNWSKYDETIPINITTHNNTQTAMLLYAPTFFNKPNISPDFSVLYFKNLSGTNEVNLISVSLGLSWQKPKNKLSLKGQILYNNTKINTYTPSNNIILTLGGAYNISNRLKWNLTLTGNFNKYGNELSNTAPLLGAQYMENTLRTTLNYRFGK